VVLEGYITQKIGHELYLFKDDTGVVHIDLDDDDWPHQTTVNEKTKVRIFGEVDKKRNGAVEIDVDHVTVIQ
jgi:uncharacterized protein (TIGR00156 family)